MGYIWAAGRGCGFKPDTPFPRLTPEPHPIVAPVYSTQRKHCRVVVTTRTVGYIRHSGDPSGPLVAAEPCIQECRSIQQRHGLCTR